VTTNHTTATTTSTSATSGPLAEPATRNLRSLAAVLPIVACVAAAAAIVFVQQPVLVVGATFAALIGWAMLRNSDLATLAVIFVLYSNVAVVAVKFHGVPKPVGAAVPLLLLLPIVHRLWIRRQKIFLPPALPLVLLFVSLQWAGVLFAVRPEAALDTLVILTIEGVGLYLLVTNLIRTPKMLRAAVWTLLLAGIVMSGVPLFQQLTRTHDNNYGGFAQTGERAFHTGEETVAGKTEQARSSGPIGEKNRYAQIMLMLLPLGFVCLAGEKRRTLKLLALAAIGASLAGAVLAFSRGAAVGLGLVVLAAVALGYISRRQFGWVLVALLFVPVVVPQYRTRLASLGSLASTAAGGDVRTSGVDGAVKGRATEMGAAALVFFDHPIFGVGPGMFQYYAIEYGDKIGIRSLGKDRQSHCLLLDVAAENGILGLLCFLGIVGVTLRDLHRTRKKYLARHPATANMATGFILVLLLYLATGLFLHFSYVRYFWLMLALATAAAHLGIDKQSETRRGHTVRYGIVPRRRR